jgi:hypothetical protein
MYRELGFGSSPGSGVSSFGAQAARASPVRRSK